MTRFSRTLRGPLFIGLLLCMSVPGLVAASSVRPSLAVSNSNAMYQRSPLSTSLLVARALHTGQMRYGSYTATAHPALNCSPAPCPLPNAQASEGGQPVNEDPIVVSPKNPMDILTGGNDYNCSSTLRGDYTSSDGGKTWLHHCSVSPDGGGCGDPTVGYDLNGVAYAGGIDSSNGCSTSVIGVETSKDNGTTWSAPVVAVTPLLGGLTDKDWMQIDDSPSSPHANAIYISTTEFDSSQTRTEIAVAHSYDGGKTWKDVAVDAEQPASIIDQFSDIAIGKDGTVYVTWQRCPANPSCAGQKATFYISKSTDGGNTWSSPVVIATAQLVGNSNCYYGCIPNTNERVADIPAVDIDRSSGPHAGNLYSVIYNYTGKYMQVEVVSSSNGGTTWTKPVPVTSGTLTWDQFFPWLTVSSTGVVGVTWLDRRNDKSNLSYETFAATSTNGGTSYGKNVQIATKPSNPKSDGFGGGFMGDYTGNYWSGKTLYASWMDSRSGTNMQDEVGGLKSKV